MPWVPWAPCPMGTHCAAGCAKCNLRLLPTHLPILRWQCLSSVEVLMKMQMVLPSSKERPGAQTATSQQYRSVHGSAATAVSQSSRATCLNLLSQSSFP